MNTEQGLTNADPKVIFKQDKRIGIVENEHRARINPDRDRDRFYLPADRQGESLIGVPCSPIKMERRMPEDIMPYSLSVVKAPVKTDVA